MNSIKCILLLVAIWHYGSCWSLFNELSKIIPMAELATHINGNNRRHNLLPSIKSLSKYDKIFIEGKEATNA